MFLDLLLFWGIVQRGWIRDQVLPNVLKSTILGHPFASPDLKVGRHGTKWVLKNCSSRGFTQTEHGSVRQRKPHSGSPLENMLGNPISTLGSSLPLPPKIQHQHKVPCSLDPSHVPRCNLCPRFASHLGGGASEAVLGGLSGFCIRMLMPCSLEWPHRDNLSPKGLANHSGGASGSNLGELHCVKGPSRLVP